MSPFSIGFRSLGPHSDLLIGILLMSAFINFSGREFSSKAIVVGVQNVDILQSLELQIDPGNNSTSGRRAEGRHQAVGGDILPMIRKFVNRDVEGKRQGQKANLLRGTQVQ